jgi:putative ABC transport system ATP-binding protein
MRNISMVYRTDLVETHALRGFDLRVDRGEFVAVTGPSGAGKTTVMGIAGLLEAPTSGQYLLDGMRVSALPDHERSALRSRKIGFVFQSFNLVPELDLRNNVEMPLRYAGVPRKERKRRAESALGLVGLSARMSHFPTQLSGGQQQRAAIARAIAGEPPLLLADEPTGNLDSGMAQGILALLDQLNAHGTTIVMVTHDPILAARASRRIRMLDGRIVGPPEPASEHAPEMAAC